MINYNIILQKFKNQSTFYKNRLKNIKRFKDIPLLVKNDLIIEQSLYPPYGKFTDSNKKIDQIYRTSGTKATPLLLSFTKNDISLITDIGADCFKYTGMGDIGNKEVVINCLNLSMWAGGFLDSQSILKTGAQVINFGTGNTNELINLILQYNKTYQVSLHCTPSYLSIIESRLLETHKTSPNKLYLKALYLGAEGGVENNTFRKSLIKKWKCNVFNANYGMSEICSIMASANKENMLRFSPLLFKKYVVELLMPNGQIKNISYCHEGDKGDLIITSIYKESQPILRYNTNETIQILKKQKKQVFFVIIGRNDDMITYKGINFFPEQLRSIITSYPELTGLYKIVIKKNLDLIESLAVLCELRKDNVYQNNNLEKRIRNEIKSRLTINPEIKLVPNFPVTGNKHDMIQYI